MKTKKHRTYILIILPAVLLLLFQFNNCSKYKQDRSSPEYSNSSSSFSLDDGDPLLALTPTGDLCEDSVRQLFATGYYKFVRTNCAGCHAVEVDRPQFANPDVNWAYTVFRQKGYSKVSDNAVSSSHQPPATGPQHTVAINSLKLEWQQGIKEYNVCAKITEDVSTKPVDILKLQTSDKPIPKLAVNEEKLITWDLKKELIVLKPESVLTNLGASANISVLVAHRKTSGGQEYYTVRSPTIYDNATGIAIKTMYVKINTRLVPYPSTFKFIDTGVPIGATQSGPLVGLVSTGGLVVLGTPTDSDQISLAFEKLELAVILPKPPAPDLGFNAPQVSFVDLNTGTLNFELRAIGNATNAPVVVSVQDMTDDLCSIPGEGQFVVNSTTCLPLIYNAMMARGAATSTALNMKFKRARGLAGTSFNRYDWDFKFTTDSVNLVGINPIQNIVVEFSKDIRSETANRLLRLQIVLASDNADLTKSPQIIYVVVLKVNNPLPINNEVTFSSLMKTNGLLNTKCVLCHNSKDLNGGYDMTNYNMMLSKNIVVPADLDSTGTAPLQSKMYRRTNANDPINFNLTPMPLKGGLDATFERPLIEAWIRAGAKNN